MKTQILISLIAMSSFSFHPISVDNYVSHRASQNLANQVVSALKQNSFSSFVDLAPTLEDIKKVMAENGDLYGDHLAEAQEDFIANYLKNTVPSMKESFDALMDEGRKRGIDWSNVSLVSWETLNLVEAPLISAPFIIAIESDKKIFRIEFTKALYMNGHWCVSQYVKLI